MSFSGCLVISASQAVLPPLISGVKFNPHIEGSYNGSVALSSAFSEDVYVPSKRRSFFVNASIKLDNVPGFVERSLRHPAELEFDRHFDSCCSESLNLDSPALVALEQRTPFGYVGLYSKSVDLFMYGLYNSKVSLLYWSDIENLDDVLARNTQNEFWVYRFKPRQNFSTVLYTKRICSRWYRWRDSLRESGQRFQALERSLFSQWTPLNS